MESCSGVASHRLMLLRAVSNRLAFVTSSRRSWKAKRVVPQNTFFVVDGRDAEWDGMGAHRRRNNDRDAKELQVGHGGEGHPHRHRQRHRTTRARGDMNECFLIKKSAPAKC